MRIVWTHLKRLRETKRVKKKSPLGPQSPNKQIEIKKKTPNRTVILQQRFAFFFSGQREKRTKSNYGEEEEEEEGGT